jgi:hypothetical protein
MKTNKHQTLLLVRRRGVIQARDLVDEFKYTAATARSYLSYLTRHELLQRTAPGHVLTKKGEERLHFFEVSGCGHPACLLCQGIAGSFRCPRCGYQLRRGRARLRPARDFLVVWRPTGVHCPRCLSQILTEEQARAIGIREEAST